jgi:hypothetical protein
LLGNGFDIDFAVFKWFTQNHGKMRVSAIPQAKLMYRSMLESDKKKKNK